MPSDRPLGTPPAGAGPSRKATLERRRLAADRSVCGLIPNVFALRPVVQGPGAVLWTGEAGRGLRPRSEAPA